MKPFFGGAIATSAEHTWSDNQMNIFAAIAAGQSNIAIEACAGGAKTSTIVAGARHIPAGKEAIFVAFNKSIADTLQSKLPYNVTASTLHSVAYKALKTLGYSHPNARKTSNILQYELLDMNDEEAATWYWENNRELCRFISILKGTLHTYNRQEVFELAMEFGIEPSFYLDSYLYQLYTKSIAFTAGAKGLCTIDFEDMLRLPVILGCHFPEYDYVFVDEAQDLNEVQRIICGKLLRSNGMLVAVGDPRQAIYAFRGADHNSFELLSLYFNCKRMPLDISYRCSHAVVARANAISGKGTMQPREDAILGRVDTIPLDLFKPKLGSLVLCRINKPLVSTAISLLRSKSSICLLGNDISGNILKVVHAIQKENAETRSWRGVAVSREMVRNHFTVLRMTDNPSARRLIYLDDLEGVILLLLQEVSGDVTKLATYIPKLFCAEMPEDMTKVVVLSSIHKAKGLEAEDVYLLEPNLVPHPRATTVEDVQQETNLHYVAVTRAKKNFYYVEREDS